jgi:hypothetical protein
MKESFLGSRGDVASSFELKGVLLSRIISAVAPG